MTTFLLIRHGSTDWVGKGLAGRLPGVGLNAAGLHQAKQLAARLTSRSIDAIYSSPLQRALETAEPLAVSKGMRVEVVEGLTEFDFGTWEGKTLVELEPDAHWKRFNALRASTNAPGGELMLQVQTRMAKALEDLRQQHREEAVAVFSHADAIKAVLMLHLNIPVDCHLRLEISPASVSVLEIADWGPRILSVGA